MSLVQRQRRECDIHHVGGDVRHMRITVEEWRPARYDEAGAPFTPAAYESVSESEPDMGKRARARFWKLLNRALTAPGRDPAADPPDRLCLEAQHGALDKVEPTPTEGT